MVLEIAEFTIKSGSEEDFVAAYKAALPFAAATPGFRNARMVRGFESPSTFVLLVEWDTVEAHTEGFRQSDRYPQWRALIGPFFADDPKVQHAAEV